MGSTAATQAGAILPNWAVEDGKKHGLDGDTAYRGLMILGLSCAATGTDALNTRAWLEGFRLGEKIRNSRRTGPAEKSEDPSES